MSKKQNAKMFKDALEDILRGGQEILDDLEDDDNRLMQPSEQKTPHKQIEYEDEIMDEDEIVDETEIPKPKKKEKVSRSKKIPKNQIESDEDGDTVKVKEKPVSEMVGKVLKQNKLWKNELFVELSEFDINKVIVRAGNETNIHNKTNKYYDVLYNYGVSGDIDLNSDQTQLLARLNLYIKDMILDSSKRGVVDRGYGSCDVPFDRNYDKVEVLDDVVRAIREKVVNYIVSSNQGVFPNEYIERFVQSQWTNVQLICNNDGQLISNVIRLGSLSEKHTNLKINTVQELNVLLKDYRYNKPNTDSFYRSNCIIRFRSYMYDNIHKKDKHESKFYPDDQNDLVMKLSFKPILATMEMIYNKARTVPIIDTTDKVMIIDNVLTL